MVSLKWSQKAATYPKFLSSHSVVCPITNMLIRPATSAALASWWIQSKLACLTYKALNTSKNTCLPTLLTPYTPPICLRSSGTRQLVEPRYRTIMGSRAFHISATKEWNQLPLSLHSSNSLPSFKQKAAQNSLFLRTWFSRNWKVNWIFTWWLTIRA